MPFFSNQRLGGGVFLERLDSYGYVDASPETRHFEEDALLGKLQYVSRMFFNSFFVYDEDYLRI